MTTFVYPRNDQYGENRLTTAAISTGALDMPINNTSWLRSTGGFLAIISQDANGVYNIYEDVEYDSYNTGAGTIHLNKRGITIAADGTYDDTGVGVAHRSGAKVFVSDSALYWYSMLNSTVALTGTKSITGQLNVDNLRLDGNTISSTNTNGDINLTPNGSGSVVISKVSIASGTIAVSTITASTSITIGEAVSYGNLSIGLTGDPRISIKSKTVGGSAGFYLVGNNAAAGWTIRNDGDATPDIQFLDDSDTNRLTIKDGGGVNVPNGSLSVGTATSTEPFVVNSAGATTYASVVEGTDTEVISLTRAVTQAPQFLLQRGNGTLASPTQVTNGQVLGIFGMGGYATTAGWETYRVGLVGLASEDHTAAAKGSYARLYMTATGGTSAAPYFDFNHTAFNIQTGMSYNINDAVVLSASTCNLSTAGGFQIGGSPIIQRSIVVSGAFSANGSVAVTGVGFTPKAIICFAGGGAMFSAGVATTTDDDDAYQVDGSGGDGFLNGYLVNSSDTSANGANAQLTAIGTDGFTFNVTNYYSSTTWHAICFG